MSSIFKVFWELIRSGKYSIINKNIEIFCVYLGSLTLYHMGGGWNPHAHIDDLAWLLRGCPKWAHFSWLCFFQHSKGPIEAISKKNFFWNLEKLKNRNLTLWLQGKKIGKSQKIEFFFKIILFEPESEFYMLFALFWYAYHIFSSKFWNFHFFCYKIFIDM